MADLTATLGSMFHRHIQESLTSQLCCAHEAIWKEPCLFGRSVHAGLRAENFWEVERAEAGLGEWRKAVGEPAQAGQ